MANSENWLSIKLNCNWLITLQKYRTFDWTNNLVILFLLLILKSLTVMSRTYLLVFLSLNIEHISNRLSATLPFVQIIFIMGIGNRVSKCLQSFWSFFLYLSKTLNIYGFLDRNPCTLVNFNLNSIQMFARIMIFICFEWLWNNMYIQ